jgi:uncharacterized protein (DUF58 family)
MGIHRKLTNWLETHWVTPAYSGWLMGGLALFFFGAATNTLAGWLYVISGVMFALLGVAAVLPARSLQGMRVTRRPIAPVSAAEPLTIELLIENISRQPKTLLQVQDLLPVGLDKPISTAIDGIAAQATYHWVYEQPTQRRGVYRWQTVQLRSATPLGLFWCRRSRLANAIAIVYPTVLPLQQCPLIDEMGRRINTRVQNAYRAQGATEGVTRTLRPYRWGDPTRLVHWRTSARYGELRVRELETFTGGQELVICLDSAIAWQTDNFEQAVIAAASLFFYASQSKLDVSLWTAGTGTLKSRQAVLEALAAIQSGEEPRADSLPELPLVWLTSNKASLQALPDGSRWLFWPDTTVTIQGSSQTCPGLVIQADQSLQIQLQSPV